MVWCSIDICAWFEGLCDIMTCHMVLWPALNGRWYQSQWMQPKKGTERLRDKWTSWFLCRNTGCWCCSGCLLMLIYWSMWKWGEKKQPTHLRSLTLTALSTSSSWLQCSRSRHLDGGIQCPGPSIRPATHVLNWMVNEETGGDDTLNIPDIFAYIHLWGLKKQALVSSRAQFWWCWRWRLDVLMMSRYLQWVCTSWLLSQVAVTLPLRNKVIYRGYCYTGYRKYTLLLCNLP